MTKFISSSSKNKSNKSRIAQTCDIIYDSTFIGIFCRTIADLYFEGEYLKSEHRSRGLFLSVVYCSLYVWLLILLPDMLTCNVHTTSAHM